MEMLGISMRKKKKMKRGSIMGRPYPNFVWLMTSRVLALAFEYEICAETGESTLEVNQMELLDRPGTFSPQSFFSKEVVLNTQNETRLLKSIKRLQMLSDFLLSRKRFEFEHFKFQWQFQNLKEIFQKYSSGKISLEKRYKENFKTNKKSDQEQKKLFNNELEEIRNSALKDIREKFAGIPEVDLRALEAQLDVAANAPVQAAKNAAKVMGTSDKHLEKLEALGSLDGKLPIDFSENREGILREVLRNLFNCEDEDIIRRILLFHRPG